MKLTTSNFTVTTRHLIILFILLIALETGLVFYAASLPEVNYLNASPLQSWSIWALKLNLILFLISGFFVFRENVSNAKKLLLPFVIIAGAAWLSKSLTFSTFRIMFDEHIYAHVGQVIAYTGKAAMSAFGDLKFGEPHFNFLEYNKEPNTYPFFISLVYQIFGVGVENVFKLNRILFGLSTFGVFLIGMRILPTRIYAGIAAFLFASAPMNLLWSNGMSAEPITIVFSIWTIWAFLFLIDHPKNTAALFLTASMFIFAAQTRPESILIGIPAFFVLLTARNRPALLRLIPILGMIVLPLLFPYFLHFELNKGQDWGAPANTGKFSNVYFSTNIRINSFFYFIHERINALIGCLAVIGVLFSRIRAVKLYLSLWFLPFFLILLWFYAGSYNFGADVRFSTLTLAPLCLLATFGLSTFLHFLKSRWNGAFSEENGVVIFLALFIVTSFPLYPQLRKFGQEGGDSRASIDFTNEALKRLPKYSLVITHIPSLWFVNGQSAAHVGHLGVGHPDHLKNLKIMYPGGIYYDWGSWCNYAGGNTPHGKECARVRDLVNFTSIYEEPYFEKRFVLYRIDPKT